MNIFEIDNLPKIDHEFFQTLLKKENIEIKKNNLKYSKNSSNI